MNVGLIGTGAIAHKHAESYREINYRLVAVCDIAVDKGTEFAHKYGAEFVPDARELCARSDIDYIDVCTFPDSHLDIVRSCVAHKKSVLVQKPISLTLADAQAMIDLTREAGVQFGVVSQHRFDDATIFLKKAIDDGRLGKIIQADGYVKWHRPQSYYDRPGKGTWAMEGGGALINQGIHTVDVLQYLGGRVRQVCANWQLGSAHKMEAEDIVNAIVRYDSGATGVIQAATAIHPGYPERIEIHGTKGSATITGDQLTAWDVEGDPGEDAPLSTAVDSGAADPMAISLEPIKRQFLDFGNAVKNNTNPLVDGEEGFRALQIVLTVYESARSGKPVTIP